MECESRGGVAPRLDAAPGEVKDDVETVARGPLQGYGRDGTFLAELSTAAPPPQTTADSAFLRIVDWG